MHSDLGLCDPNSILAEFSYSSCTDRSAPFLRIMLSTERDQTSTGQGVEQNLKPCSRGAWARRMKPREPDRAWARASNPKIAHASEMIRRRTGFDMNLSGSVWFEKDLGSGNRP